jgi:hypothetical protein
MSKFQTIARALAPAIAMAAALTCGAGANAAEPKFYEDFEDGLSSWTRSNNSEDPTTFGGWTGSVPDDHIFDAFDGAYASVDWSSSYGGTISAWLISPTLSFSNGDVVSFHTISRGDFPDRLELRFSADGGTNVGSDETSVGKFAKTLLVVNPGLTDTGYPTGRLKEDWAVFSATISGLSGPTNGAIAFRYFVTDGGYTGSNSDLIAVDSVTVTAASDTPPVPEPATYLMMALGLGALGLRRMRATRS